jgi:hypothetical protein
MVEGRNRRERQRDPDEGDPAWQEARPGTQRARAEASKSSPTERETAPVPQQAVDEDRRSDSGDDDYGPSSAKTRLALRQAMAEADMRGLYGELGMPGFQPLWKELHKAAKDYGVEMYEAGFGVAEHDGGAFAGPNIDEYKLPGTVHAKNLTEEQLADRHTRNLAGIARRFLVDQEQVERIQYTNLDELGSTIEMIARIPELGPDRSDISKWTRRQIRAALAFVIPAEEWPDPNTDPAEIRREVRTLAQEHGYAIPPHMMG